MSKSFGSTDNIFYPKKFSVKAYDYVITAGDTIWRAYGISIVVTLVGTLLSLLIICLYAYPLSRQSFRYKNFFAFFAYFTMIFGGGLVPWYMVYTQLVPIKNTIWIMIVPYLMNAWYMMIMRTFFRTTVHESIIESAKIDGAGEFRTFFVIVLPLCRAGLLPSVCSVRWGTGMTGGFLLFLSQTTSYTTFNI